jgi:hypothetical protein
MCKIYKDATLFFSQDKVSSIANVIPTMDRIDALLSRAPVEPLSPSVKHALQFARTSINKYYSKTDLSIVYRIAMGMFLETLFYLCSFHSPFSPSSTVKAQVFSTAPLVKGLDCYSRSYCSRGVCEI